MLTVFSRPQVCLYKFSPILNAIWKIDHLWTKETYRHLLNSQTLNNQNINHHEHKLWMSQSVHDMPRPLCTFDVLLPWYCDLLALIGTDLRWLITLCFQTQQNMTILLRLQPSLTSKTMHYFCNWSQFANLGIFSTTRKEEHPLRCWQNTKTLVVFCLALYSKYSLQLFQSVPSCSTVVPGNKTQEGPSKHFGPKGHQPKWNLWRNQFVLCLDCWLCFQWNLYIERGTMQNKSPLSLGSNNKFYSTMLWTHLCCSFSQCQDW